MTMSHDDQDQVFKYYVLQTISGKEEAVKDYINGMRDVEPFFDKNVGEILVPMETTFTKRRTASGNRVERVRPYYSGFVFVEARLAGETTHKLRRVPGVLGFIGGDVHPEPLSDLDVKRIKEISDRLAEGPEDLDMSYSVGDRVKVNEGPFTGFFGDVTEVSPDSRKLKILVKVFGRDTSMEVDYTQVEKESES